MQDHAGKRLKSSKITVINVLRGTQAWPTVSMSGQGFYTCPSFRTKDTEFFKGGRSHES